MNRILKFAGMFALVGVLAIGALVWSSGMLRAVALKGMAAQSRLYSASAPAQQASAKAGEAKSDDDGQEADENEADDNDVEDNEVDDNEVDDNDAGDHMVVEINGVPGAGEGMAFWDQAIEGDGAVFDVAVDQVADEPGILVLGVAKDGAAAKAGIKRGDVVLSANGQAVNGAAELMKALADKKPGETVTLKVRHGDAERDATVTLSDSNGKGGLGLIPFGKLGLAHAGRVGAITKRFVMRFGGGPVTVGEVVAGSPAATAGLKADDKITAVDGQKLDAEHGLVTLIGAHKPGDSVTLDVEHEGAAARKVTVKLAANPDRPEAGFLGVKVTGEQFMHGPGMMGGHLGRMMDHFLPRFNLDWLKPDKDGKVEAVIVGTVKDGSAAAKAGLKDGDVITAVDGKAVASPDEVVKAVAAHKPGDAIQLTVRRKDAKDPLQLSATLGAKADEAGKAELGVELNFIKMLKNDAGQAAPGGAMRMPFEFKLDDGTGPGAKDDKANAVPGEGNA